MRPSPWLLLAIVVVFILWLARGVLGPFVVGAMIAYAFSPVVRAAQERTHWPRIAVIGIGYIVAVAIVVVLVVLLADQALLEFQTLSAGGPDAIATTLRGLIGADSITLAGQTFSVETLAQDLRDQATGIFGSPGDAIHLASESASFLLDAFLTVVVSFYLLLDGPRMLDRIVQRIPDDERRDRLTALLGRIHLVLGKWLRGQLLLIALVTVLVYVILGPILNVPHALAIAILTGVLEILPLIGPLVATAIAAIIAFSSGGLALAVIVVVIYFILRQVEDQVVMPVVIGRIVHLHPVVTIFAVLVGLSAFGILGGLLGVPVAAAAVVIFNEFFPAQPDAPDLAALPATSQPPV
jgi:predicted PurR-regulated permease PerM